MYIIQLGKYYPPHSGGMESYLEQVCTTLAKEHEVTAITFNECNRTVRERRDGVDIVRIASLGKMASQPIALTMGLEARRLCPSLLHLHWPNPLAAMVSQTQLRDIPIVVTHHSDVVRQRFLRRFVNPFYSALLRRALKVFVLSPKNAEFSQELAPRRGDVAVIPSCVDESKLPKGPRVELRMAELRWRAAGAETVLGFVGRHVGYKGLEVLLEAIVGLPGCHALIIGDGPLHEVWRARARDLGVASRAHFLGCTDEATKVALYQTCDIFVLPSLTTAEAFGIAQVEAQLFRCPIVTSDLPGGVSEVTRHGETGFCTEPGNVEALRSAIRHLIERPDLRRRFGDAGYRRARERYTAAAVTPELLGHFRDLEWRIGATL